MNAAEVGGTKSHLLMDKVYQVMVLLAKWILTDRTRVHCCRIKRQKRKPTRKCSTPYSISGYADGTAAYGKCCLPRTENV